MQTRDDADGDNGDTLVLQMDPGSMEQHDSHILLEGASDAASRQDF